jgi:tRNA pseudouridine55 synthase
VTRSSGFTDAGVLVIDKPAGMTSHDVVARARRALRTREVGHAGTLDPMATGVLVVAVGQATKLVPWLTALDKSYEATIALGSETDTLDADGRETGRRPLSPDVLAMLLLPGDSHEPTALREALERERARTSQVPPAYSAIRTDGERSFARARRGEDVVLPPRSVAVRRLDVVGWSAEPPALRIVLDVAKGYYVRSLARDLADALDTAGHLTRLRRTKSGDFRIDEAVMLDATPDELRARIIPLGAAAARALPAATLSEAGARDARHGRPVQPDDHDAAASVACAWLDMDGTLVAIGRVDDARRGTVVRGFC